MDRRRGRVYVPDAMGIFVPLSREETTYEHPQTLCQHLPALRIIEGHGGDRPAFLRAQDHDPVSRRAHADEPALSWPARAAPVSEWRRALHRLQAVRGGVPGV